MTIDKGIYIKNIYYMLSYAFQQLKKNNYEDISGEDFEDVYDLFAEIIVRGVSHQLKQGLHKEYVTKHDTLSTLKGKLDINGTIQNLMQRKLKVDCEYDDFSVNNLFNKILKTTMLTLVRIDKVKTERKHKLRNLLAFFKEVNDIDAASVNWTTLRFDRNSRSYQMLLYICYFIMDGLLLTTESGTYKMSNYSDEHMSRLYEKFVLEYYRKHFPHLNARAAQIDWNINKDKSSANALPIMQTDIMLSFPSRTLIIDTKYYSKTMQEKFGKATFHSNNVYQIQAYVTNEDKSHAGNVDGMLLYAKTEEDVTPNDSVTLNDGNILYFRTLDLNQDFNAIKEELNKLISQYTQS